MIKSLRNLCLKKITMRKIVSLIAMLSLCLCGCLVDITSITVPSETNIGKVVTFTVNASAIANGTNYRNGIILQIPSGTKILRKIYYNTSTGRSGFLQEDAGILTGYTPEPGYELYGAVAQSSGDETSTVTFTVWLAVPDGVALGTYAIKAATGGYDSMNTWIPQYPQTSGTPIKDFTQISGKYTSNSITIFAGTPDTTPPADVTPSVQNGCPLIIDISGYNEPQQGDVAQYHVYVSDTSFISTTGGILLDATTSPSVNGNEFNFVSLSASLEPGLFYFEVPPGSQFPINVSGLSLMNSTVFLAVTAVDLSNNESSPLVVSAPLICPNPPAMRHDLSSQNYVYSLVQTAYDESSDESTIMLQALDFPESPNFNKGVSVIIAGGYDCCYVFNDQYSVINGTLTISEGTVTVENLILK